MLISMLKYIKVLRHVPIVTDHHQGVDLYLVKVTELFKILKFNPGVVAAIHVAGVRGDACGAVRWTYFFKQFSKFNEVRTYSLMMIC